MHSAVAKKKILALEMGQKKNSGRQKIPHPPHLFSNGPSLIVSFPVNCLYGNATDYCIVPGMVSSMKLT